MTVAQAERQDAELKWWQSYLDHPTAKQRMWALYGARYYGFFWREMTEAGSCVEIGSGPLPVMEVMECRNMLAVDTLGKEYRALTGWPIATSVDDIDVRGRWDTVLLLNILDHADNPQALVEAAYRLVRPGKRVLVYVQLGQCDDKHSPVSESEVETWLIEAGFEIERHDILKAQFDPPAYAAVARKPALSSAEGLRLAAAALNGAQATWWIACGTALGCHREGDFIAWDHDIDLGVKADSADASAIKRELEARGFEVWRRLGTPRDGYVMQFEHPMLPRVLDVYFFYRDGDRAWMAVYPTKGRRRYEYDAELFDTLEDREMQGITVKMPPVAYLEAHYGADWRTPRKDWRWDSDPLCLR